MHDNRPVRVDASIPLLLKREVENTGINFSEMLQRALKEELNLINEGAFLTTDEIVDEINKASNSERIKLLWVPYYIIRMQYIV